MKFSELLNIYYYNINLANSYRERNHYSNEFIDGFETASKHMYKKLKYECEDFPKIRCLRDEEKGKYYDTKAENTEAINMFTYRMIDLPVFLDDAGQQYYTLYEGKYISAGSYNTEPEIVFSDFIDNFLDE